MELHHCDALEFLINMPSQSVSVVFTDPPYDFGYGTKLAFQNQFEKVSRGHIAVFYPPENRWVLPDYLEIQYLYWVKAISTKNTSKKYSRFVEEISVMDRGKWNTGRHWSQYTNIFTDLVDDSSLHPHRKPPSLWERLILNHTDKGDIILDPFMGSGSCGEAALRLGREYIGVELDEKYFEIAKNRLESSPTLGG